MELAPNPHYSGGN